MKPYLWWILLGATLIGHFGLNLAIYNRLNAFGGVRRLIKLISKLLFAFTVLLPPLVLYFQFDLFCDILRGRPEQLPIPMPLLLYSSLCLSTWIWLGVPWLVWRPIFGFESIHAPREAEHVQVDKHLDAPLALSRSCQLQSRFPLNQIFELAVETIELPVVGLPKELDGYRLAHLSDIHLTGDVRPDFTRYAVERASQWEPDLMALTGDIIDKEHCIDWLEGIFSHAKARDGCFYILGNHDTQHVDSDKTREAMALAGWTDMGGRSVELDLQGVPVTLIGNEHPWYPRPSISRNSNGRCRILLSHSPDQIWWARKHDVKLMLAGHTHGGQGRLPLAGPLLSPSLHGSRYASGDFYKSPTTMHVTRGLGGAHLMRINCRPELSLLTLRAR